MVLAVAAILLAAPLSDRPLIPTPIAAADRLLEAPLPPSLDGRLGFAYAVARREGHPVGDLHWLLGDSVDAAGIQVTVRFRSTVATEDARALEGAGCIPARLDDGQLANVGPVVAARCSWEGLWRAAENKRVVRISPTFGHRPLRPEAPPVDRSGREVEALQLSEAVYPGGHGQGVIVCDMDSGVDPFHPFFFRADGGAFAWIDANSNGAFEPLIDGVDFNRNGRKDSGESLGIIKAPVLWLDWYVGTQRLFNVEPEFLAGHDWLFQDENEDGVRNQGPLPPYGDAKPTFGEQLFVADDVNQNGRLDVGERVLALKTPKIRAIRTPSSVGGQASVYTRGQNLAQVREPHPGAFDHGSMVLGTVAGGVPGVTRYFGIAPEADLLLASSRSSDLVTDLAWALQQGAHIVLWEMATWYGEFLDGSENLEVACDAASDQGVLQIGAAGNLGGSDKHRVMTHPAGTQMVPLVIPSGGAGYVYGDFLWREQSGAVLSFRVTLNGQTIALSGNQGQTTAGNTTVQWGRYQSARQTNMLLFYFVAPSGGSISGQTVEFEVTNTGSPVELHGYVTDDFSGWSKGVYWPSSTGATDFGTYGTPGTGDKTLSVATYFAELLPSGAPKGELATYSGRGPRIDRADSVDFAAPEDHITAYVGSGAPFGAMWIGGGTSNASPVAVGVAALLKGVRPSSTPAELAAMMRAHALVEASMGTMPNDAWGRGKVRGYRAHFDGMAAPANEPPLASGVARRIGPDQIRIDASASTDPEGEPLRFRWDFDYDGTWDVGPTSEKVLTRSIESNLDWVKLEAVDAKGRVAHAVIPVMEVADAGSDAGTSGDGGTDGGGGTLYVFSQADSGLGPPAACGCGTSASLSPGILLLWWWLRRRREQ